MTQQRKSPARWRKARNPDAGGRWDTPMNRMIWNRDHGQDLELWQGDKRLAVVAPGKDVDGWMWSVSGIPGFRGPEATAADARLAVKRTLAELAAETVAQP